MSSNAWSNKQKIRTTKALQQFLNQFPFSFSLKPLQLAHLATYLEQAITESRPHENPDDVLEFSIWQPSSFTSFTKKELKKNLGSRYQEVIDIFFSKSSYGKTTGLTRAYSLNDKTVTALVEFIKTTYRQPLEWKNTEGRAINKIQKGILKTTDRKQKAVSTINITGEVPVNLNVLSEVIEFLCSLLQRGRMEDADKKFIQRYDFPQMMLKIGGTGYYLRLLYSLYLINRLSVSRGRFPQIYRESDNGRITGIGFNLQNTSGKTARRISLLNQNLWDYDMEASTPTIFHALGLKHGVRVDTIELYLKDKKKIRQDLADSIGSSVNKVKSAVSALFYGAGRNIHVPEQFKTSLISILGNESHAEEFLKIAFISNLIQEIQVVKREVLRNADVKRGKTLVNVLNKSVNLWQTERGLKKKLTKSQQLSHIIFGYEALIIQTTYHVLKGMGVKTYLLISDGFVAEKADGKKLEDEVKVKLKNTLPHLELKYSMESLTTP